MSSAVFRFIAVLFWAASLSLSPAAFAEKKLALVVGNDRYPNLPAARQLEKAVNDARAVDKALAEIGFSVSRVENASKSEMSRALGALEQAIAPGDTVFLFFAGHGIDVAGTNYLLPSDVPSPVDREGRRLPARAFRDASFNAAEVLSSLQERGTGTVIAVFDACREPFDEEGRRSLGLSRGGLAEMRPSTGMFIMFSAGAKQLALDRLSSGDRDPNSVFTRSFVPLLRETGLSLVSMAKQLQPRVKDLAAKINHVQTPAYYDQIMGDFFLRPGRSGESATAFRTPPPPPPDPCNGALDHWRSAEGIGTRDAVADHLSRFPNCNFAGLAKAKLAAIGPGGGIQDQRPQADNAPNVRDADPSICRRSGSLWNVDGATAFLEGTPGDAARKFYLCQPNGSLRTAGARPGSMLFSGRRSGNRYEGVAYAFAGKCGSFSYGVSGQVSNGDRTVTISGRQPLVDNSTCKVSGYRETQMKFDYHSRVN